MRWVGGIVKSVGSWRGSHKGRKTINPSQNLDVQIGCVHVPPFAPPVCFLLVLLLACAVLCVLIVCEICFPEDELSGWRLEAFRLWRGSSRGRNQGLRSNVACTSWVRVPGFVQPVCCVIVLLFVFGIRKGTNIKTSS